MDYTDGCTVSGSIFLLIIGYAFNRTYCLIFSSLMYCGVSHIHGLWKRISIYVSAHIQYQFARSVKSETMNKHDERNR